MEFGCRQYVEVCQKPLTPEYVGDDLLLTSSSGYVDTCSALNSVGA